MAKQFLSFSGLSTFLTQLESVFAKKECVLEVKESTDPYIFDIDYSKLKFNTDLIISGNTTSGILGVGELGAMILGG